MVEFLSSHSVVELAYAIFLLAGGIFLSLVFIYSNSRKAKNTEERLSSLIDTAQSPTETEQKLMQVYDEKPNKWIMNWFLANKAPVFLFLSGVCLLLNQFFGLTLMICLAFLFVGVGIRIAEKRRLSRKSKQISSLFPEAVDLMVRGARVGVGTEEMMRQIAAEIPDPISLVFRRVLERIEIGISFEDALKEAAAELELREFRYLAATLSVQRRTGSPFADVLENLSQVLRENQEQKRRAEAATSEARLSSKIVSVLVVISCILLFLLNRPQFDFLVNDPEGQNLALYCTFSLTLGFYLLHRLLETLK